MANRKPFSYPRFRAFDGKGKSLEGGTAEFFDAGTTTNRTVYSDPELNTATPNPITLNSRGEPESGGGTPIDIYLDGQPYKIVLKDSDGNTVWTIDDYIAGDLPTGTGDEDVPTNSDIFADTLSDLQGKDTSGYSTTDTLYLRGRASVGDGGEGHFRWDSSDLSTEVGNDEVTAGEGDGGVYVAPDSDKTGASGAWVRQFTREANAKWYGAATSDNTAIIQSALDSAGAVYIPEGYAYDRRSLTLGDGDFVIDDSTGIRVTSKDHWWAPRHTKITTLAHRAGLLLAPENTMAGISNAYHAGFDGVEVDVMFTSDDVPILMHDTTVDRTTDGSGDTDSFSLSSIQALDAGSYFASRFSGCKVPTLETALDYMKGRFERIHLELKDPYEWPNSYFDQVVNMVIDRDMQEQVIFISYSRAALNHVRISSKAVGLGYIDADEAELPDIQKQGGRLYCSFKNSVLNGDPDIVSKATEYGISVYGKVTNTLEEANDLMDHGVGVIQSDCGVMLTRRESAGSFIRYPHNLEGVSKVLGSGSITSDPDTRTVTITSVDGDGTVIKLPTVMAGGDYIEAELYARVTDGDPAVIYINPDSGFGGIPTMEVNAPGDVYRIRERLYLYGGNDNPSSGPVNVGYGSGRAGTVEIFDMKVTVSSVYHTPHDGTLAGLIELTPSSQFVKDNIYTFGIAGVELDPNDNNVVQVLIEHEARETLNVSAEIADTDNSTIKHVKYLRYISPGGSGNVSSKYAALTFGVFNADGTTFDLTASTAGNLLVRG